MASIVGEISRTSALGACWNGDTTLRWRHNERDGVSNHQSHDCLLNRLFRRRSKETSKLRVTGLCVGNSPVTVEFPHKGPVTQKMFPFGDVSWSSYSWPLGKWTRAPYIRKEVARNLMCYLLRSPIVCRLCHSPLAQPSRQAFACR